MNLAVYSNSIWLTAFWVNYRCFFNLVSTNANIKYIHEHFLIFHSCQYLWFPLCSSCRLMLTQDWLLFWDKVECKHDKQTVQRKHKAANCFSHSSVRRSTRVTSDLLPVQTRNRQFLCLCCKLRGNPLPCVTTNYLACMPLGRLNSSKSL